MAPLEAPASLERMGIDPQAKLSLVDEVWTLTEKNFLDKSASGIQWDSVLKEFHEKEVRRAQA
jgi:hypothetical protein